MITNNGFKILINRTAKAVPDYTVISKTKFGSDQVAIAESDNDLLYPIPFDKYAVVNACDATTNWSGTAQTLVSLNTTTYKEGTGSLNIYKTSATSNTYLQASNGTLTSRNFTDKYISFWIYFKDQATIDKFTGLVFEYGTDNANYYYNTFYAIVGWNNIRVYVDNMDTHGAPTIGNCVFFSLQFTLGTGTDTIAEEDIILDDIYLVGDSNLIGDIDVGYPVINETEASVTYRGTITTSEGNGFLINSFGTFNTDASALMEDIFLFPGVSKSNGDIIIIEIKNKIVRR